MADHMDPSSKLFLHIGDLKLGNNLPLYFANLKQPKFLPKEKADSIPFSTEKLPQLLQLFSFQPETPQAQAMEATLKRCDSKPVEGEAKFCATSSESMFHFIRVILGLDTEDIKVLSSSHLTESNIAYQNFTLMGFEEYLVQDAVGCHSVPYPYTVYYCHFIDGTEARVFNILLQGGTDGAMVKSVVVCHMDTSQWDPEHVSFQVLGTQPGKFSPVCHIFPESDILSIPVTSVVV